MTLYGSLIVYSTDTFSEHCCQTRASLPHKYEYRNIENIEDVILYYRFFFIYRET